MKHSTGPWKHADSADYTIVDARGESVCTYHLDSTNEARDLANARLIAAAPEILEMLKLLASSTAVLNHLDIDDNQRLCDLIEKAEGK